MQITEVCANNEIDGVFGTACVSCPECDDDGFCAFEYGYFWEYPNINDGSMMVGAACLQVTNGELSQAYCSSTDGDFSVVTVTADGDVVVELCSSTAVDFTCTDAVFGDCCIDWDCTNNIVPVLFEDYVAGDTCDLNEEENEEEDAACEAEAVPLDPATLLVSLPDLGTTGTVAPTAFDTFLGSVNSTFVSTGEVTDVEVAVAAEEAP